MKSKVTIKDIALHLGVSPRSVSQALNGGLSTSKVSVAKRERIERAARQMGYRANRAARVLRTGRSGLIGALVFDYHHPFVTQRLEAALAAVKQSGYGSFAHLAGRSTAELRDALHAMLDARVEGILAIQPVEGLGHVEFTTQLAAAGIPLVAVGGHWLSGVDCYLPDKQTDFRELVTHVVEEGCQSLVLVMRPRKHQASRLNRHHHDRAFVAGFRDGILAARRRGIKVTGRVHRLNYGQPAVSAATDVHPIHLPGYQGMLEILGRENRPDAVLFQGDIWAHGALRACTDSGVNIPQDIVITGYDGDPYSSAGAIPLTTMLQSHPEICRLGVERLLRRIRDGAQPADAPVTIPGKLVCRRSSARNTSRTEPCLVRPLVASSKRYNS